MVSTTDGVGPGSTGEALRDLRRRLGAAGVPIVSAHDESYHDAVSDAVRLFQLRRGLSPTGECDHVTWTTLVEAGHQLGDRHLYLRSPMIRGDDVADLQHRLGSLGFDAGRVDGIFGPDTEHALKDFQRNSALTTDGVLGRDTRDTLLRLGHRTAGPTTVAGIREQEAVRSPPRELLGQRLVVGEPGGLGILVAGLERRLTRAGADVLCLHHPDPVRQAQEANRFGAELFLGLAFGDADDEVWYYKTTGYSSYGGQSLAELLAGSASRQLRPTGVAGRWHPVLRETRMPAVQWQLTSHTAVSTRAMALAQAAHHALEQWFHGPTVESPPPQTPPG